MSVLSAFALLVKVTLVLGAAWALAALLRRRTAAARHDVWTSALLAAVALVALGRLAPAIELPWIPARGADGAGAAPRPLDEARGTGTARACSSDDRERCEVERDRCAERHQRHRRGALLASDGRDSDRSRTRSRQLPVRLRRGSGRRGRRHGLGGRDLGGRHRGRPPLVPRRPPGLAPPGSRRHSARRRGVGGAARRDRRARRRPPARRAARERRRRYARHLGSLAAARASSRSRPAPGRSSAAARRCCTSSRTWRGTTTWRSSAAPWRARSTGSTRRPGWRLRRLRLESERACDDRVLASGTPAGGVRGAAARGGARRRCVARRRCGAGDRHGAALDARGAAARRPRRVRSAARDDAARPPRRGVRGGDRPRAFGRPHAGGARRGQRRHRQRRQGSRRFRQPDRPRRGRDERQRAAAHRRRARQQ